MPTPANSSLTQRLKSIAESFSGPQATSIYLGLGVLLLLSVGTAFSDINQDPADQLQWNGIAFQSFLLSSAYYVVVSQVVRFTRTSSVVWNTVMVALLYFTTEMLRALFVGVVSFAEGLSPEVMWGFRIVAGGTTGIVLMGMVSTVLNDFASYRRSRRQLLQDQAQALAVVNMSEAEFATQRSQLLANVREAITAALHAVLDKPRSRGDAADAVVAELVHVSDEVIRPLSHDLFGQLPQTVGAPQQYKVSLAKVFATGTTVRPFDGVSLALIGFFLLLGATLFGGANPLQGLMVFLLVEAWILGVFTLLQKYLAPILSRFRPVARTLIYILTVFLATTPVLLALNVGGTIDGSWDITYLLYWFVLIQLVVGMLALYAALTRAREEVLAEQQESVQKLAWTNARLGAQLWRDQTLIAKALHNDVQPIVIAAALRLQQALAEGKNPEESLNEIKQVLLQAAEFTLNPKVSKTLTEVVRDINNRWLGILTLKLKLEKGVAARLKNDPVCMECAADFVTEFATNSVKHGRAKNGTVTVSLGAPDVLSLVMVNDGLPRKESRVLGLGSMMMQNQSLRSNFENLPEGGIRFSVDLALV